MRRKVWAKIPRAGLANKILVWANAEVFAHYNKADVITTNWLSVFIGPLIRGEASFRFYRGYFNQDPFWKRLVIRWLSRVKKSVRNVKNVEFPADHELVIFDSYMDWLEFFDRIREQRDLVKKKFLNSLLKPKYQKFYKNCKASSIGVHIRMGDFGKMQANVEFNSTTASNKQTPISYFIHTIEQIRHIAGDSTGVTIFSDGSKEELAEVLKLKNVELSIGLKDIEDLLKLSKSSVIVTSASSTFSLFAAYLSEAVIIHHPNFYIRPVRDNFTNEKYFEGVLSELKSSHLANVEL